MNIDNRERRQEIWAVVATGALKFILMDWLQLRIFYILIACGFWLIYIYRKYSRYPDILKHWGFQKHNLKASFFFLLPLALLAIAGIIVYGMVFNDASLNGHILWILLLYPLWGIFQQFMIAGLIAGNLRSLSDVRITRTQVVLLTSLIFALVHYPSIPLMFYVFVMETIFLSVYFKWKNLWSLGLFHGWVSGVFIFVILERDLWMELWQIFQ